MSCPVSVQRHSCVFESHTGNCELQQTECYALLGLRRYAAQCHLVVCQTESCVVEGHLEWSIADFLYSGLHSLCFGNRMNLIQLWESMTHLLDQLASVSSFPTIVNDIRKI